MTKTPTTSPYIRIGGDFTTFMEEYGDLVTIIEKSTKGIEMSVYPINYSDIVETMENLPIDPKDQFVDGNSLTPYRITQILQDVLGKYGLSGKVKVSPQMIYNYSRNGRINGIKGSHRYSYEDVMKFVAKFVKRQCIQNNVDIKSILDLKSATTPVKPSIPTEIPKKK